MKINHYSQRINSLIVTTIIILLSTSIVHSTPDYTGMVDEIDKRLKRSLSLYRSNDVAGAKKGVQSAYFEIFENLEGPIRINISAKKNFDLESEFGEMRKLMINGASYGAIKLKMERFTNELKSILPILDKGYQITPEVDDNPALILTFDDSIESFWAETLINIQSGLEEAHIFYLEGEDDKAVNKIISTQFDYYKNTLMETAVRRYVSARKDFDNNSRFTEIARLIRDAEDTGIIQVKSEKLVAELYMDLPNLPIFEGAEIAKKSSKVAEKTTNWRDVKISLEQRFEEALSLYRSNKPSEAIEVVQDSYFDLFEASGMEKEIGARDAGTKAELERYFSLTVGMIKSGRSETEIMTEVSKLMTGLDKVVDQLDEKNNTVFSLFIYSLLIILREGFEAILIITAIITYLVKTGNQDKVKVIYNACLTAILVSILTAVLVKWVFNISAASQELIEGITMLFAAVVLFGVSYWMISKAEAEKWQLYIKKKLQSSLSSGSVKALWLTSFLAVFREGAETVLFYAALGVNADLKSMMVIGTGFFTGAILLAIVYYLMKFSSTKIPMRIFFALSGSLLYVMSFSFVGNGILELVEAKVIEPSMVPWNFSFPPLGIHPYWQTLIPQFVLIICALAAFGMMIKNKHRIST